MALKKKTQKHSGPVTYSLKTPLFANAQQAFHEVKIKTTYTKETAKEMDIHTFEPGEKHY